MDLVKKLPFTIQTLLELGVTKSILNNRFEEWMSDPNYFLDSEEEMLHVNMNELRKKRAEMRKYLTNSGMEEDLNIIDAKIDNRIKNLQIIDLPGLSLSRESILKKPIQNSIYSINKEHKNIEDEIVEMITDTTFLNSEKFIKEVEQLPTNPFPSIFKGFDNGAYNIFKSYVEDYIVEPYIDFSFIFQQLKSDNLLHSSKHKSFMEWLYSNQYVSEKVYSELMEHGHFRSLSKCYSLQRFNNYRLIKEKQTS